MPASRPSYISALTRAWPVLGAIVFLDGAMASAQEPAPVPDTTYNGWQRYDWLKPSDDSQAVAGGSVNVHTSQNIGDPFTVLSTGALDQEKVDAIYTRPLADGLSLTFDTSSTLLNESSEPLPAGGSPDDVSHGQTVGLQFQPTSALTLGANLHSSTSDATLPNDTPVTSGAGFSAMSHLPFNSTLNLNVNSDRTATDTSLVNVSTDTTCDAQFQQPFGPLPLTAVFKGHLEDIYEPGLPAGSTPSLEQSLVWKPLQITTLQMGLRQQKYQEYPGIDNQLNQALFADWSQQIASDLSWHSYAEVLNSRGMIDQAPASPLASGANGTAQATMPGSNSSLTSSLPISLDDQTLTFSTGPSIRLQKDISASLEYSNRWDKNPSAGNTGQEQRVSVSVKGTF